MTDEAILLHLLNKTTIIVDNTWYFTGRSMECSNSADFECCGTYYESFEEALESIRRLAGKNGKIALL